MNLHAPAPSFPGRIGRSLTLALGIILAFVLLIGGVSVTLALRIYDNINAADREYGHILRLDRVHTLFDDMIFELQQMGDAGRVDKSEHALIIHKEIVQLLDNLTEAYRGQGLAADQADAALGNLYRRNEDGRDIANRMVTTRDRTESDRHWLMSAVHEVPHLTAQLIDLHRARIVTLHESSEHMIEAIVILFAAFTTIGATLVVVVRFAARRGIALPIHRLANAAQSIAEGRLETRVSVRHANEIGLLSHSFNVMAAGLQEHDRALHLAQVALQEKVRELQALYRIGTEISRLQTLDRILQLVVDRARELLRCDAAALCIAEREGGGNLVPIATSGPPDAFRLDSGDSKAAEAGRACAEFGLFIRPEYARGYVASALRLGQAQLGTIQVGTREERTFTADESAVLSGLATQAAIAVERTRLLQDVHTLAVLEERERLAREMHDSLAQILGLLHLKLKDALEHTSDTQAVAAALGEMVKIADGGYEEVRQSIFGLRNFVSRGLGLVPTLTEYLHEFSAQAGIAVALEIADQPLRPVSPATEVQAVRIIQEALANVRKHAKADQARVRLKGDDAWIEVRIEDNGVGWDHEKLPGTFHFGLQTMRERAESLGGRLEIDTASGRGTRVTATLPRGGI